MRYPVVVVATALACACGGAPAPEAKTPEATKVVPQEIECGRVLPDLVRNVTVELNVAPLRGHPLGDAVPSIVAAVPAFRDVLSGVIADPVRDVDWAYLGGPSAKSGAKDLVLVHHGLDDEAIERGVENVSKRSMTSTVVDLHVPGAKGTLIDAGGGGPQVLVRAVPHLLAIAPPERAEELARVLVRSIIKAPKFGDGEALRASVHDPHAELPRAPASVKDARVVVVPRADGGLDVSGDADCVDAAAATELVEESRSRVFSYKSFITQMLTGNVFDAITIDAEGPAARLRVHATRDQVTKVLFYALQYIGAQSSR